MDVETLFCDVYFAVGEPAVEMEVVDGKYGGGESVPTDVLCLVSPVADGVVSGLGEGSLVGSGKSKEPLQQHIL